MIRLFFLLSLFGCATGNNFQQISQDEVDISHLNLVPRTVEVYNGKVKYITFPVDLPSKNYNLECISDQKEVKPRTYLLKVANGQAQLYYAENYHSQASSHECYLKIQHNSFHALNVKVKQFPYKQEFLNVARKRVVLSQVDQKRVEKEWLMTREIYKNSMGDFLIEKPFRKPLKSKITSYYGKRRIFNKIKKTQHLGYDFRAGVGKRIPASNDGKVVFVGNLFYTGNVVIIDHGMNLFTLYAHLSKFKVKLGDMIQQGQIIGLAGRTGRVSGPHLHWGVKLHGNNVDGLSLVEESKKQFLNNVVGN